MNNKLLDDVLINLKDTYSGEYLDKAIITAAFSDSITNKEWSDTFVFLENKRFVELHSELRTIK